uniref:glucuronosyltransferase n=1 Tax=Denticeps clupeoides TaxID=299321 RepID=A0AAY4DIP8_9TELE
MVRTNALYVLAVHFFIYSTALAARPGRMTAQPGKLLVVPMDGSHWIGIKAVAEEMGKRGHRVLVVMPEVSMRLGPGIHYSTRTYPVPYGKNDLLDTMVTRQSNRLHANKTSFFERVGTFMSGMKNFSEFVRVTAESLLLNEELVEFLKEQKFDALLTNPVIPTGAVLARKLSLPPVYLLRGIPCGLDLASAACPSPPSYVPRFFTRYTDNMSFGERVVNTLAALVEPLVCKIFYWEFDGLASRVLQEDTTVAEILAGAPIWLERYDFTLEKPRPLMPNMVLIGGINCGIRSPLAKVSIFLFSLTCL